MILLTTIYEMIQTKFRVYMDWRFMARAHPQTTTHRYTHTRVHTAYSTHVNMRTCMRNRIHTPKQFWKHTCVMHMCVCEQYSHDVNAYKPSSTSHSHSYRARQTHIQTRAHQLATNMHVVRAMDVRVQHIGDNHFVVQYQHRTLSMYGLVVQYTIYSIAAIISEQTHPESLGSFTEIFAPSQIGTA